MRMILILTALSLFSNQLFSQHTIEYNETNNNFILKNSFFERIILNDKANNALYTTSFTDLRTKINHCYPRTKEFTFKVNGKQITGGIEGKMLVYRSNTIIQEKDGREILRITLNGLQGKDAEGLEIAVFYEIYPDSPVIRKWLAIKNSSVKELIISDLEWENINYEIASPGWVRQICTFPDVYAQYGQSVHKPPYIGRTDDAAMLIYDYKKREGLMVGNEAPSILKRTSIYSDSTQITIGMGLKEDDFPFKKYLKPGELFTSPKGFLMVFKGDVWQDAFDNDLAYFVRKYMGVKLFEREKLPIFMYNTWNPFNFNINSKLIREIADVTSKAGVEYLIMDDGWQNTYGDWLADKQKFPDGLKPVCDYIISKGMKPGIWISFAHVTDTSEIFEQHPEWLVRNREGGYANLHAAAPGHCYTMCLGSPWFDHYKQKLSHLIETNRISYIKLDLAAAYSSYKLNNFEVGCYATNHEHKDKDESIYMLYSKIYQLCDELKLKFPDLYIDITFELYGRIYGIDYSLIQHADGDWLSNVADLPPYGSLYVRKLCYERARILPPSTLLIGNMQMNWKNSELCFQSLLGSTAMMLGDPRKLSPEKIKWFKTWSDWAKKMEEKYGYRRFYQTSDVFTMPEISGWDGCARINPDKGGILCFYRNESPESTRTFPIKWVDAKAQYKVYSSLSQNIIGIFSGETLINKGLKVEIPIRNSAEIFEIEKQ